MASRLLFLVAVVAVLGVLATVADTSTAGPAAQVASPTPSPFASPFASPVIIEPIDPGQATVLALSTQLAVVSGTATAQAVTQATISALSTGVAAVEQTSTAAAMPPATDTPPPTPTPEPTLTPPPAAAGTVLYDAAAGGFEDWTLPAGWAVLDGQLLTDGTSGGQPVGPPVDLSAARDYAVEIELNIVRAGYAGDPGFAVTARGGAIVADLHGPSFGAYNTDVHLGDENIGGLGGPPYDSSATEQWHTYRLEVRGNTIRVLIDGQPSGAVTDNRLIAVPAGAPGLLNAKDWQVSIRTFRVVAL
jgi:hypothetical protein